MPTAKKMLNRAIEKNPTDENIYVELSRIESEQLNQEAAERYLEKALKINPDCIPALCTLASIKTFQAETALAEDCYKKVLAIAPDNPYAVSGLAMLYSYQGEYKKAEELIRPLLDKKIVTFYLGKVFISICRHIDRCDEAIDYLNKLIEEQPLTRGNKSYCYYELGKAHDRKKQYDTAFSCYQKGNELAKQFYNENENRRKVDEIISTFSPEKFVSFSKAETADKRPVFIIGMPRSGTSLTEQILASHPDVCAGGEMKIIGRMTYDLAKTIASGKNYPACVEDIDQQKINQLSNQYSQHITSLSETALRISNKMPRDFYDLGFIRLLFPDACIIHCQRNAIDNCLSIYFQNFGEKGNEWSNDLKMIAAYYKQYKRLMQHWCDELQVPMLALRYESMVEDQEKQTRRLLDFCQLEWHDNCLNFHELKRTIATASFEQVRQPMYRKSVERWRNYEPYIEVLIDELGDA
ncbi:MAG TPA: hypothetical protein ENJ64_00310 [Thiotrichales bacterium]|nr:hypothetical protein [Thiotrichales bacterium]